MDKEMLLQLRYKAVVCCDGIVEFGGVVIDDPLMDETGRWSVPITYYEEVINKAFCFWFNVILKS